MDPGFRFVALGASNLTRMALTLLDAARAAAGGPIEAHAALGRGRSYGIRSRLFGRTLDGIDGCGLWDTLAAVPPRPTLALVMDVGNDLLYDQDVPRILAWVDAALVRLRTPTTQLVIVGLPLEALRSLTPWRFRIVRTLLVPQSRLTLSRAWELCERLHSGLALLAERHGARFHVPPGSWYGSDPVHVRRACWHTAARTWCDTLTAPPAPALDGALARLRFRFAAPAQRSLLGRPRATRQPCRRWGDGTTLSLW